MPGSAAGAGGAGPGGAGAPGACGAPARAASSMLAAASWKLLAMEWMREPNASGADADVSDFSAACRDESGQPKHSNST